MKAIKKEGKNWKPDVFQLSEGCCITTLPHTVEVSLRYPTPLGSNIYCLVPALPNRRRNLSIFSTFRRKQCKFKNILGKPQKKFLRGGVKGRPLREKNFVETLMKSSDDQQARGGRGSGKALMALKRITCFLRLPLANL